jgi:hypothetical protein
MCERVRERPTVFGGASEGMAAWTLKTGWRSMNVDCTEIECACKMYIDCMENW